MRPASQPREKAPPGTCDSHFHIFGPYDRFPLAPTRGYDPPPALVSDYLAMADTLGIQRMVVVQASVSGTDNAVTLDAVRQFGVDRARAVVVINDSFDDAALRHMHDQGARGVRFNIFSGGGTPEDQLETLARRLAPLGWHIQVYAEGEKIEALAPVLARLPVDVVIDHCGGVKAGLGLDHPQFQALRRLLDSGRVWLKTSSYRASSTGHPWTDVAANVQALVAHAPDRCVWGTDWPHPQIEPMPDSTMFLDQFMGWVTDPGLRQRILVDNPGRLYGF